MENNSDYMVRATAAGICSDGKDSYRGSKKTS